MGQPAPQGGRGWPVELGQGLSRSPCCPAGQGPVLRLPSLCLGLTHPPAALPGPAPVRLATRAAAAAVTSAVQAPFHPLGLEEG